MGKDNEIKDLNITLEDTSEETLTETDQENIPDAYENPHYTFFLLWSCRIITVFITLLLWYTFLNGKKTLHTIFFILFHLLTLESILQSFEYKENTKNVFHFYAHIFLSCFSMLNLILGLLLLLNFTRIEVNSLHSWLGLIVSLLYLFVFLFGSFSSCRETPRLKIIHEIGGIFIILMNSIVFCIASNSLFFVILFSFFILIFFSLIFRKNHVNLRRDQEDFIGNPLFKDVMVISDHQEDRGIAKIILRLFC